VDFLLPVAAVILVSGVARLRSNHRSRQSSRPPPPPQKLLLDPPKSSPRRHLLPDGALPGAALLVTFLTFIAAVAVVTLSLTGTPGYEQAAVPKAFPLIPEPPTAPPPTAPSATTPPGATDVPGRPAISSTSAATTGHSPTPVSTAAAATGDGPVLTSISPSVGSAGQTVTILGSHLISSDGHISVTFGAAPAITSCPTQAACRVVVPVPQGNITVPVTLTTQSGTSNTLAFRYA
jgi:IPT/TIG domain